MVKYVLLVFLSIPAIDARANPCFKFAWDKLHIYQYAGSITNEPISNIEEDNNFVVGILNMRRMKLEPNGDPSLDTGVKPPAAVAGIMNTLRHGNASVYMWQEIEGNETAHKISKRGLANSYLTITDRYAEGSNLRNAIAIKKNL